MQLSWEALTALASIVSSLAVLAAVMIAIRQVRVGAAQVDHLRRATQLEGAMKVYDLLTTREQIIGRRFIVNDLERRLRDDRTYRDELEGAHGNLDAHPEFPVMRLMEMIGIYVKHGLLDSEIVFDYWDPNITNSWDMLEASGAIKAMRARVHPALFVNFERLIARYKEWERQAGLTPSNGVGQSPHAAAGTSAD